MSWIEILIIVEVVHNFLGGIFLLLWCCRDSYLDSFNAERMNPVFLYEHSRVNWFGAAMLGLFANLLCPIGTIIYWFYKLCTVGR